jgi:SAM-dependent methyltransferase
MSNLRPDWHDRYLIQASWTKDLRNYCYQKTAFKKANQILEVGCGTGVITQELSSTIHANIVGLDIKFENLQKACDYAQNVSYSNGDAHNLPFACSSFDVALCHFLLLWVRNPLITLKEMKRVTRSGGAILALAEPDYGGRIDYPDEFTLIGNMQTDSLTKQGANPFIGRQLSSLFFSIGLVSIEIGILGARWLGSPGKIILESEWTTIRSDLSEKFNDDEYNQFRQRDLNAWQTGKRILFVPTFYAYGCVP